MAIEKYSCYEFELFHELIPVWNGQGKTDKTVDGYVYKIYGTGCMPYDDGTIESDEWYETEEEARCAVMNKIDSLENGE